MPYYCQNERRRQMVARSGQLNGIDYLEIAPPNQRRLHIHFLHPLPGQPGGIPENPELTIGNFLIIGGSRIRNIEVVSLSIDNEIATIEVDRPGDFSRYTLALVRSETDELPPSGFDPRLASVEFSFKIECPNEFDCAEAPECSPEEPEQPRINYLAKDYTSFRQLMLDRMSLLSPEWQDRNPADKQMALVELTAYIGDYLSYYQDAAATEAYLQTARRRPSIRRHTRMLDYHLHEGCNARTWVTFEIEPASGADGFTLEPGSMLLTDPPETPSPTVIINPNEFEAVLTERPLVFESMHPITLRSSHNRIPFYTWSDDDCCLPAGTSRATLLADPPLQLEAGDLLIFEQIAGAATGLAEDADPSKRHVVRLQQVEATIDPLTQKPVVEIEWHPEDALPFALVLTATNHPERGPTDIAVARGNVVLADHGRSLDELPLTPSAVPDQAFPYRPVIGHKDLTFREYFDPEKASTLPANGLLRQSPQLASPVLELHQGDRLWVPQHDLLASNPYAEEFVVELEEDRTGTLRFGDGIHGKQPTTNSLFTATGRIGSGPIGNIGAEAITRIVWAGDGITTIRNPLAAAGGMAPEKLEEAVRDAPQAFKIQERAVTTGDFETLALRHSGVQRASAEFRWTGSRYVVFLAIDRVNGREVDADFIREMLDFFEPFRIAGYDLAIIPPTLVPLQILLRICVDPLHERTRVQQRLRLFFSSGKRSDGTEGFFHPDRFSFGDPLYLSAIIAGAMAIEGVQSVEPIRFCRYSEPDRGELGAGVIAAAHSEVLQLSNDPNFPEKGAIHLLMEGGR